MTTKKNPHAHWLGGILHLAPEPDAQVAERTNQKVRLPVKHTILTDLTLKVRTVTTKALIIITKVKR